ncbi:MAG: aminotransferase class I/II-fold pyridoxal phosphate-dependent enzyme [Clostridiales bacterium]|nr:aminotransferase class I/II-fold pyridoxal phosphate-dependent enzyme [Clostridiales bacterium]
MNSNKQSLYEKLHQYSEGDFYPFHMPGHKRTPLFDQSYSIDITEIHGFDDLHHPEGILKEKMEAAAKFYHADESFFLINGSTGGILSAISAVTEIGDEILIARNCHKSVFHAVFLRNLKPHYVYPPILDEFCINGGISVDDVENELKLHPNIKAVVIVSPTYEGIVSDIKAIAAVSHKYYVPLIVDEAHGAHFAYGEEFPRSALDCGADIVIQSLHKTLPAMTQTAILHKKSSLVSSETLQFYLQLYQTSSPSYVLMASIDTCLDWMRKNKNQVMADYNKKLNTLYEALKSLNWIWHLSKTCIGNANIVDFDRSKIVFGSHVKGWSGKRICVMLREMTHLEMEMCTPGYVIAMTSVMDTEEGIQRLIDALRQIDKQIEKFIINGTHSSVKVMEVLQCCECSSHELQDSPNGYFSNKIMNGIHRHKYKISPYEASLEEKEVVCLEDAVGRICAKECYIYPPGIPFFIRGEQLEEADVQTLLYYREHGFEIRGGFYQEQNKIYVLKER